MRTWMLKLRRIYTVKYSKFYILLQIKEYRLSIDRYQQMFSSLCTAQVAYNGKSKCWRNEEKLRKEHLWGVVVYIKPVQVCELIMDSALRLRWSFPCFLFHFAFQTKSVKLSTGSSFHCEVQKCFKNGRQISDVYRICVCFYCYSVVFFFP